MTIEDAARDQSSAFSRIPLLVPAGLAAVYPWLVLALGHSILNLREAGGASWILVLLAGIVVSAVPGTSLAYALALGNLGASTPDQLRARRISHLAFAAPSLLVAMGNFAGLMGRRSLVPTVWLALWVAIGAFQLFVPAAGVAVTAGRSAAWQRVRFAHGVLAVGILAVFLLPHLSNHVAGLWSGETHIGLMTVLRGMYRSGLVEPVLVAAIALQMVSGLFLFFSRVRQRAASAFETLQTLSGVYLGVFLTSHMTAAFSARLAGVDPNWHWLTNNGPSMLGNSPNVALLPHYFFGPLLVAVHLACGLRAVLLEHGASDRSVGRMAGAVMALGMVAAVIIVAGLLGVHVAAAPRS